MRRAPLLGVLLLLMGVVAPLAVIAWAVVFAILGWNAVGARRAA